MKNYEWILNCQMMITQSEKENDLQILFHISACAIGHCCKYTEIVQSVCGVRLSFVWMLHWVSLSISVDYCVNQILESLKQKFRHIFWDIEPSKHSFRHINIQNFSHKVIHSYRHLNIEIFSYQAFKHFFNLEPLDSLCQT